MPSSYRVEFPPTVNINDTAPYAFATYLSGKPEGPGSLPMHRHPNGLIGMAATAGRFEMDFEFRRIPVPRHTAVYVPPGTLHNSVLVKDMQMISLHIGPEVCREFLPDQPVRYFLNPMLEEMLKHFARVHKTTDAGISARRIASVFIQELAAAPRVPEGFAQIPTQPTLRRIAQRIIADPGDEQTIDQWGAEFEMSGKTLARLVVRETGLTFGKWRLNFKLLAALEALNEGASVEAAADAAGYATTSAFITSFAKVFECTPGVWRETFACGS